MTLQGPIATHRSGANPAPVAAGDVAQISALVYEFSRRVDIADGVGVERLFTDDGRYESNGAASVGRVAIADAYAKRRAHGARVARHIVTNLQLSPTDHDDLVRGDAVLILFAADGRAPYPSAQPIAVIDVEDVFRHEADTWLIQSRVLTRVFFDPDRAPFLPLGGDVPAGEAPAPASDR